MQTLYPELVQLGSTSGLGPEGRLFESDIPDQWSVSSAVELSAVNRSGVGSNPTHSAISVSFNGRTLVSKTSYRGSNPCAGAKIFKKYFSKIY